MAFPSGVEGGCRPLGWELRDRGGFALLLAVLVLLALTLLTPTLVVVGSRASLVADARLELLRARAAAESAVRVVEVEWSGGGAAPPDPGEMVSGVAAGDLLGGARFEADIEGLSGGRMLIRARGWVPAGAGAAAEVRIGHIIPVPPSSGSTPLPERIWVPVY